MVCALAAAPGAEARRGFLTSIWGPIKFAPGAASCDGPERCSAFPYYRQLGADVLQYQLVWDQIAPTRPRHPRNPRDRAYRWSSELRFAVQQGRKSGMKVMFMLKGSPRWANGGRASNWAPRPKAFAAFAVAAARKFRRVHLWEIWGEPTRRANFLPQGGRGARRYARILNAAYRGLKRVSRRNIVIGGMSYFGGNTLTPSWIKHLRLPNGKPPPMDWYGHNPFDPHFPRIKERPVRGYRGLNDIDTLWREVRRHYRGYSRPRKLWLSEWTIQTDHASYVFSYYVSRAEQARWLRAAFRLARKQRYVKGMGFYQLIDYPPAPSNPTWGLLTYDGARKPAFSAFQSLP